VQYTEADNAVERGLFNDLPTWRSWSAADIGPTDRLVLLFVRPAGRTYLELKVLYTLGKGEVLAERQGCRGRLRIWRKL